VNRCVPAQQVRVHIATETLALLLVPVLWSVGGNPALADGQRLFVRGLALGTLVVDGWLLYQNLRDGSRAC